MWAFIDKIPVIEAISINEENDIEIKHSKGHFKINNKDLVDIQMKSDLHSLNSNPNYNSDANSLLVILRFYGACLTQAIEYPFSFLDLTRSVCSIFFLGGLSGTIFFAIDDLYEKWYGVESEFSIIVYFAVLSMFMIFFDRSIRTIFFPFLTRLFFNDFLVKDIYVLKSVGNVFLFRNRNEIFEGNVLPVVNESVESAKIKNFKKYVLYFLFYVVIVCLMYALIRVVLLDNIKMSINSSNYFLYYFIFGGIFTLITVGIPIITFLGAVVLIGSLFLVGLFPLFVIILGPLIIFFTGTIVHKYYYKLDKISATLDASRFLPLWIGLGVAYYFIFESSIYLPIYNWSITIEPFWYSICTDLGLYIFIISVFSTLSVYIIGYIIQAIKKNE